MEYIIYQPRKDFYIFATMLENYSNSQKKIEGYVLLQN